MIRQTIRAAALALILLAKATGAVPGRNGPDRPICTRLWRYESDRTVHLAQAGPRPVLCNQLVFKALVSAHASGRLFRACGYHRLGRVAWSTIRILAAAAIAAVASTSSASAQTMFTGSLGNSFGGDAPSSKTPGRWPCRYWRARHRRRDRIFRDARFLRNSRRAFARQSRHR